MWMSVLPVAFWLEFLKTLLFDPEARVIFASTSSSVRLDGRLIGALTTKSPTS
jgi:hypothetical protein